MSSREEILALYQEAVSGLSGQVRLLEPPQWNGADWHVVIEGIAPEDWPEINRRATALLKKDS